MHVTQFFRPFFWHDFNGKMPFFVRLCMWCCTLLKTFCRSAQYFFLNF